MSKDRVALYLQDAHSLQEGIELVQYAEETDEDIVLVNLDFTKAFDSVNHNSLFCLMKQLELPL